MREQDRTKQITCSCYNENSFDLKEPLEGSPDYTLRIAALRLIVCTKQEEIFSLPWRFFIGFKGIYDYIYDLSI